MSWWHYLLWLDWTARLFPSLENYAQMASSFMLQATVSVQNFALC